MFPGLRLHLQVNDQPLLGAPTDVTTLLRRGPLTIRLRVTKEPLRNNIYITRGLMA